MDEAKSPLKVGKREWNTNQIEPEQGSLMDMDIGVGVVIVPLFVTVRGVLCVNLSKSREDSRN